MKKGPGAEPSRLPQAFTLETIEGKMPKELVFHMKDMALKPGSQGTPMMNVPLPSIIIRQHIEEIPPGESSTLHSHATEALIFILKGKGYSEVQGRRADWEEGDIVYVPPWAWHRHFNKSKKESVRFLASTTGYLLNTLGNVNIMLDVGKVTYKDVKKMNLRGQW